MLPLLVLGWAPIIVLGGLAGYLALRFVRAAERRGTTQTELDDLRERLLRLEEGVASVAADVGQLAEGQRFTTRVLTSRSSASSDGRPLDGVASLHEE